MIRSYWVISPRAVSPRKGVSRPLPGVPRALASGPEAGIWGGTTEQERRALSRHLGVSA